MSTEVNKNIKWTTLEETMKMAKKVVNNETKISLSNTITTFITALKTKHLS
jgi:flagellar hook-associated protein FlgK